MGKELVADNILIEDIKEEYVGPSMGFSINYKLGLNNLRFDYSWQAYPFDTYDGSTPANHLISLTYGWGGVPDYRRTNSNNYGIKKPPVNPIVKEQPTQNKQDSPFAITENKEEIIDKDTDFEYYSYKRYSVEMDVSEIKSMDFRRVVFYLRPQTVIKTSTWKLYVFKAKIKDWSEGEIDRWALKVIEGKGIPPINVVWDGTSQDGVLLPKGKYFAVLTAEDVNGQKYATKWHKFHIN